MQYYDNRINLCEREKEREREREERSFLQKKFDYFYCIAMTMHLIIPSSERNTSACGERTREND